MSLAVAFPAAGGSLPFLPGEKLTFLLKWEFVPAGVAVLEVLPVEQRNGQDVYHFVLSVESNSFMDVFYKVRDRIDAYATVDLSQSVHYRQKQHEGGTRRDIVIAFDWERREAHYSNFGEPREPLPLLPGSLDPLSVFYYARFLDLRENLQIERAVTDGKKNVLGRATVVRRERISLPSGEYDTYLLEPELDHIGGVFEKSRDAKIQVWISADHRRIPLQIKSKVAVGSFVGELIAAEGIALH